MKKDAQQVNQLSRLAWSSSCTVYKMVTTEATPGYTHNSGAALALIGDCATENDVWVHTKRLRLTPMPSSTSPMGCPTVMEIG